MRIAFLVGTFPMLSETFVLNQITGLIDRGHEVDIYAWQQGDTRVVHPDVHAYQLLARTRFPAPTTRAGIARPWALAKLIVTHWAQNPRAILRSLNVVAYGREAASGWLLRQVVPFLGQRAYDIIQCHFAALGTSAARLKRLGVLQGQIVVMFHGWDIRLGNQEGPHSYRPIMNHDTYVLSISAYNRRHLLHFGFDPGHIIDHPVGIDLRRFPWHSGREPPSGLWGGKPVEILTVARLVHDKGLDQGLLALREVLTRNPSWRIHYTVVGEGDQRRTLERLAADLNLEASVTWAGAQDQALVARQLQQADLFLLPSRNEALPVCLMEAQASGLPVVATAVGSVHEVVAEGRSGFLVPPGDVAGLADRLAHLIEHPEVWPTMGRAGRAHIEAHYDIEKLNDRLVDIYQGLAPA